MRTNVAIEKINLKWVGLAQSTTGRPVHPWSNWRWRSAATHRWYTIVSRYWCSVMKLRSVISTSTTSLLAPLTNVRSQLAYRFRVFGTCPISSSGLRIDIDSFARDSQSDDGTASCCCIVIVKRFELMSDKTCTIVKTSRYLARPCPCTTKHYHVTWLLWTHAPAHSVNQICLNLPCTCSCSLTRQHWRGIWSTSGLLCCSFWAHLVKSLDTRPN